MTKSLWYVFITYIIFGLVFAFVFGKGISCTRIYKLPTQRAVAILNDGSTFPLGEGYDLNVTYPWNNNQLEIWDGTNVIATFEKDKVKSVRIEYIKPQMIKEEE